MRESPKTFIPKDIFEKIYLAEVIPLGKGKDIRYMDNPQALT